MVTERRVSERLTLQTHDGLRAKEMERFGAFDS